MKKIRAVGGWGVAFAAALASVAGAAETNVADAAAAGIHRVADVGKYAFVLFHRGGNGAAGARETVKTAVAQSDGRAGSLEVEVSDPASASTVRKYGADRAPLPLVLVIAPNGAVTAGFPESCEPRALAEAMVGKTYAACLKSLQDGKLVFVTAPGTNAANNQAAMKGVTEMAADERFAGYTDTLQVQADDNDGGELLAKLKVADAGKTPVTVLLAPPGRVVGTYTGATEKATMVADLMRAMAGATGGSGGCGSGAAGCGAP